MKEEFTTNARRWYDKDPVLSSAMKTLEESDDETQIKVALNLIKMTQQEALLLKKWLKTLLKSSKKKKMLMMLK